jgi:hypothetical protein
MPSLRLRRNGILRQFFAIPVPMLRDRLEESQDSQKCRCSCIFRAIRTQCRFENVTVLLRLEIG